MQAEARVGLEEIIRALQAKIEFSDVVCAGLEAWSLNCDPLHFIERNLILAPVVELRRSRRLVVGEVLHHFKLAAVLQVRGDAGRAEGMVPDPGLEACGGRAALDHAIGVLLPQGVSGERAGLAGRRPEQRAIRVAGDPGRPDVVIEQLRQIVVTGNLVFFAAFFVQADPATPSLHEIVAHVHLEHGVHAREGVDHHADQRPVAQSGQGRFFRFSAILACRLSDHPDAVQEPAGLIGRQDGRLAFFHDVAGTAHGVGRVHIQDVAGHQPVEEHPQCGQVLFDGGRGKLPLQVLDEGGDVDGLDAGELVDATAGAPVREAVGGVQVRLARMVVVDLGGEKLQDALGGLRRRREKRPGPPCGVPRGVPHGVKRRGGEDLGGHGCGSNRV